MDVGNGVVEYMRRIDSLTVECVHRDQQGEDSPYDMCQVNIGIFIFSCTVILWISFLVFETSKISKLYYWYGY